MKMAIPLFTLKLMIYVNCLIRVKALSFFKEKKLQQYGLIEEVKVGNNQPNRIYLTDKLIPYMTQGERL